MNTSQARPWLFAISLLISLLSVEGQPLAVKGDLILSNPFAGSLEKKKLVDIESGWQRRVSFGDWTVLADGSVTAKNVPEDGHGPVLTYIAPVRDLVIECEFKIPVAPLENRHFRIFLDHLDYAGHAIQSTANVSSIFRPAGLTLQHISRTRDADKRLLKDIEFGPAELDLNPNTWYKMRLDIVGDRAWTVVNGVSLYGRNQVIDVEKSKIGLNPGIAGGSIRNFKVWTVAEANEAAGVAEALEEINERFANTEVEIVEWPLEIRQKIGKSQETSFHGLSSQAPVGQVAPIDSIAWCWRKGNELARSTHSIFQSQRIGFG